MFFLDLAATTPQPGPTVVIAGKQIGPVKLGMSEKELQRMGAVVDGREASLGDISATLDARGRVKRVAAHFNFAGSPPLLVDGSRLFHLEFLKHTGKELVTYFAGCKRPYRTGDDQLFRVWRCAGIRVEERLADGDPELNLFVY